MESYLVRLGTRSEALALVWRFWGTALKTVFSDVIKGIWDWMKEKASLDCGGACLHPPVETGLGVAERNIETRGVFIGPCRDERGGRGFAGHSRVGGTITANIAQRRM